MTPRTRDVYQREAVEEAARLVNTGRRRVLMVGPTGCGKTHVIKLLTQRSLSRGWPVVVLVHGRELVANASKRLADEGIDHGVVMAGVAPREALVQICSVDSITSRGHAPPARVIVSDEAHHDSAFERTRIREAYDNPIVFGLTATPERGDGVALGEGGAGYEIIVEITSVAELQALWLASGGVEGLVPLEVYGPADSKPRRRAQGMVEHPLDMYARLTSGERMLAFYESREEAAKGCAEARERGWRAEVVDGLTADRAGPIERFAAGELDILCSVDCLTEGVDIPEATVCGLFTGISYWSAYMQRVGRVLRPLPSKPRAVVLDPYGHTFRCGWHPSIPRRFHLDGRRSEPVERVALRSCKWCGCVARPGDRCPRCGEEQPHVVPPRILREEARLAKLGLVKQQYERQWRDFCELVWDARAKGHDPRAPLMRFKGRWGHFPPFRLVDVQKEGDYAAPANESQIAQ